MGKKDTRLFTREFKRNAVQMVIEKGMPVGRVAQELDIHPNLLHQRKRKLVAAYPLTIVACRDKN
ncbi:MAG: transposase [Thermodesulfovibrionales bacterium]